MHRHSTRGRSPRLVAIPLLALIVLIGGATAWPAFTTPHAPDTRVGAWLPRGARVLGPLPANTPLRLIVGLAPRNQVGLDALLARDAAHPATTSPGSNPSAAGGRGVAAPLTPAQFIARFSPTAADERAVIAYLRAHGLRIVHAYPDRLMLDVAGTAARVAAAFDVPLVSYRARDGRVYYANLAPPRLPGALGRLVNAVVGLRDDLPPRHAPLPRLLGRQAAPPGPHYGARFAPDRPGSAGILPVPMAYRGPAGSRRSQEGASPVDNARTLHYGARSMALLAGTRPRVGPQPRVGTGRAPLAPPAGALTPSQLQSAYDFTPIYTQTFPLSNGLTMTATIDGSGETVALYELSPFDPADVASYDAAFGISTTAPVSIAVDGGATDAFTSGTGAIEAAMDIEMVQAIAPGAHILVYSGPASPNSNDNTGADDTYERIVSDDRAQVLSTSWGLCEPEQSAVTPPDLQLLHTIFAHAVAEGMTVVAASGDTGANDCTDGGTNPSVDYPASDPYVLGVGGTTLTLDGMGNVQSETGWAGSGGGGSAFWPLPSWQAGLCLPPGAMRQVPDVAMNAGTSYAVWIAGGWQRVDGTSAGPPIWAALLALVAQARDTYAAAQGTAGSMGHGLGDVHPQLYAIGAAPGASPAFRDVISGPSNGVATPGPGWDAETGWGAPDAYHLLRDLIGTTVAPTPAPASCPTPSATATSVTATPTASVTAAPTATATATAGLTPTVPLTPTPPALQQLFGVRPLQTAIVDDGVVVLQLTGAMGSRGMATIEITYPGQKPRIVRSAIDAHGRVQLRLHAPRRSSHGRAVTVRLRVTMQIGSRILVATTSFRVLPASAPRHVGGHGAGSPPAPACRPAPRPGGVRGLRPCGPAAGG